MAQDANDDGGASPAPSETGKAGRFEVQLENFNGPFDLLLSLISKHELNITEIALAKVTDEFIGYIRAFSAAGDSFSLDEASEFLVIAATLLDLKAARLLPSGEVEDEEDIALLEARDLLFARLLQYKAFKEIARQLGRRLTDEGARFPRAVPLEPQIAAMMPELTWRMSPSDFAAMAAKALEPREPVPTEVGIGHLHAPAVSVREQADIIGHRLREQGVLSFRQLTDDADSLLVVVARFLALLEMFRDMVITMDQASPLGELTVRWSAGEREWTADSISEEYDRDAEDHGVPPVTGDSTEGGIRERDA